MSKPDGRLTSMEAKYTFHWPGHSMWPIWLAEIFYGHKNMTNCCYLTQSSVQEISFVCQRFIINPNHSSFSQSEHRYLWWWSWQWHVEERMHFSHIIMRSATNKYYLWLSRELYQWKSFYCNLQCLQTSSVLKAMCQSQ